MSADQVAEITPLIREVFEHARENPAAEETLCATFEVVESSDAWAQVTPTELNIAYPARNSPDVELREVMQKLPAGQLQSWEPEKFATWSFASFSATDVAKVVDLALTKLFNLGDYSLDGKIERL
jgi:hypothetical protein